MPVISTVPCEIFCFDGSGMRRAQWSPVMHEGYRFEHLPEQRDVVVTIAYIKLTPDQLSQMGSENGARLHIFCYPLYCIEDCGVANIHKIFSKRKDTPKLLIHNEASFNEHGPLMKMVFHTIIVMRNLLHLE